MSLQWDYDDIDWYFSHIVRRLENRLDRLWRFVRYVEFYALHRQQFVTDARFLDATHCSTWPKMPYRT